MTCPPPRDPRADGTSRRRFGRLAAGLGLATGVAATSAGARATDTYGGGDTYGGDRGAGRGAPYGAGGDPQAHYAHARRLAGNDPVLRAIMTALTPDYELPRPPAQPPLRLFDNLVLLSAGWVSALAVLTDDGIVLLDALATPEEAESVLLPGLREVGADPAAIRYVAVTHGHPDHYGAARHLAERYGARVLMSPADWDLVARTGPAHAPVRDLDLADGQRLTLGGTTIRFHHTPGHTPGTVSPILPVRVGRERRTAMLWGGANPPESRLELAAYLESLRTFRHRMRLAGVDVELSNHPNDHGLERAARLRADPSGPNPFVLGRRRTDRFMAVMTAMLRGRYAAAPAPGRPAP
ncbi:MBL fold metallo-hydrolase [Streptomyces sp. NPDC054784]